MSIPNFEDITETDQTKIIKPDSLMVNQEKVVNPIKESEIIDIGSTDRVFLYVGDFEDEDEDTVNLYFNDDGLYCCECALRLLTWCNDQEF